VEAEFEGGSVDVVVVGGDLEKEGDGSRSLG